MGQGLAAPVTTKESGVGCAPQKGLSWGHSCMQGWRVSMEDAHLALAELPGQDWRHVALFGVMDGHGGEEVARFCEKHLPSSIASGPSHDIGGSLISAFHDMDVKLCDPQRLPELRSLGDRDSSILQGRAAHPNHVGCTACVCCVTANSIIVANCGDSRAVLCRNGQAVPLSEDHKPNCPRERQRILKAGGTIERSAYGRMVQFRINGNLNLSRSIGDLGYKKNPDLQPEEQMVTATPDVDIFPRQAADEFFVIACDGVWDVMGSQDVVDFIRDRLPRADNLDNSPPSLKALASIMEELLDNCISPDLTKTGGLGGDNMTAIVVVFDNRELHQCDADPVSQAAHFSVSQNTQPQPQVEERGIVPSGLCGCAIAEAKHKSEK